VRWLPLLLFTTVAFADGDLPIGTNPGAIPSSGKPVTGGTPLKVGQVLQVKWGRTWWAARVVALKKNGSVRITYAGWAKSWDEWVERGRLQLDKDAVKKARRAHPAFVLPPLPAQPGKPGRLWHPGPVPSSNERVRADAQLIAGQLLQVKWGNQWWGAKVVAVKGNGSVRITYVGWEKSWDEWVERGRLQLDTNPPTVFDHPPK